LIGQNPLGESGLGKSAVAVGGDLEMLGQSVYGFAADAVQADRELEDIGVVFGTGIDDGDAIYQFAERNAAAEIPHLHPAIAVDANVDPPARSHDELIHGIVQNLFQENVDAVIRMAAVAESPDVHAGPQPDMLKRAQGFDLALVVDIRDIGRRFHKGASK